MWGYYGSKSKVASLYPEPKYRKIIEPFAGTAQYSLLYWDRDVTILDKYEVVVRLWRWLQQCSKKDILETRRLSCGDNVDSFDWDCEERKWLVGFIIAGAPSMPKKTATKWKTVIRPNTQNYKLNLIADNLHKIRHWEILQGNYEDIENREATWFIDPPYVVGGKYYRHGTKDIDYELLSEWCRSREGQVIVCEGAGAEWLPFKNLTVSRGNKKVYEEYIWIK